MKPLIILASLLLLAACAETRTTAPTASAPPRAQTEASSAAVAASQPSAEIADAQQHLRTLGLYEGAPDGIWGPDTQAAVHRFQQEQGLAVTAELDSATLRALRDQAEVARSEPITLAEPTDVRTLQNRLRQLGFFDGRADGVWGPTTQVALEEFQRARSLPVGQVTAATLAAMGLDAADFPMRTAARTVDGDMLEPRVVRSIQQRLDQLGFYTRSVDGIWGPATQAALTEFQRSRGLEANGQLNPTTARALGLDPNNLTASAGMPQQ